MPLLQTHINLKILDIPSLKKRPKAADSLLPFEIDLEFARIAAAAVQVPTDVKVDIRKIKKERRIARERESLAARSNQ